MTTWQVNKWKMGDFKPIIIEEIVIFIIDYGYRAKWKLIRYAIQYNTIYNIYLPYTTFTDGKKKMKKIDDRK